VIGGLLYVTSVLAFWRLARFPDGAERNLIALLRVRFLATT